MFNQIIKKIESEKANDVELSHGLDKAIEIIKESEVMPFIPEIFGFTKDIDPDVVCDLYYKNIDDFNLEYFHIAEVEKGSYLITKDAPDNNEILASKIKINSHFEGEIILKSLGVIE